VKENGGKARSIDVSVGPSGLARFSFTPSRKATAIAVEADAESESGADDVRSFEFETSTTEATVLLRTDKSLLRVGDSLVVDVLAAGAASDAYLDVTRENQTVAVASVPLEKGTGRYRLDLDASLSGTIAVSAYVLSLRGEYTRDTRVVFVQPAQDLQVDVTLDRAQYKPADKAHVDFQVKGSNGKPAQAALGIHVVDEAVFALSESRPGLLKLFFALEEELLKPSYQIGPLSGQTLGSLILGAEKPQPDAEKDKKVQMDAEAAIAAQGDVEVGRNTVSSFQDQSEKVTAYLAGYGEWLRSALTEEILKYRQCHNDGWNGFGKALDKAIDNVERDAWGRKYTTQKRGQLVTLASAGPDEKFETWDDVEVTVRSDEICPNYRPVKAMMMRGGAGGWDDADMMVEDAAIPMAATGGMDLVREMARNEGGEVEKTETTAKTDKDATGKKGGGDEVRVSKWFPETLFVENCLVNDENGKAGLDIPLADSITTWRMSTVASDKSGNLGGTTSPIVVFQDFFVDIDFPVFLTRNDQIEFPLVVYNYLETEQDVELRVDPEPWFELMGQSNATLKLGPGEVKSVRFPVRVKDVGWHKLTVLGKGSAGFADAVQRTVQVRPDGKEVLRTAGGKFKTSGDETSKDQVTLDFDFPWETIPGSQQMVVQILPGLTSHVVQGMDSMLRLPGG